MNNSNNDFQDMADYWFKGQLNRGVRLARLFFKRGKKLPKKISTHNWKKDYTNFEKIYYANKAIFNHANRELPFNTLALIGEVLSQKEIEKKMKKVIHQNVFSHKGHIYKLDDLESQKKIQKILKNYEFDEVIQDAA